VEKEMDKIAATTVEHAMTPRPVTVTEDTDIEEVASLMVDRKIHTIPVLDARGKLSGIIGKEDVLRTLIPQAGSRSPH
jgi:CBS domain-containing protein